MLTSMLNAVGIDRNDCYIDNVMQERPPGNNFGAFYKDKQKRVPTNKLVTSTQRLLHDLHKIKPKLTICLGAEALRALTGERKSIDAWRGSVMSVPSVGWVMGTYHPSFVLRMYGTRGICELDLRKALRLANSTSVKIPKVECLQAPSYEQALEWIKTCESKAEIVAFDIETVGKDVRCIAFSYEPWKAFCIPFVTKTLRSQNASFIPIPASDRHFNYWSLDEEKVILERLSKLFLTPSIKWIAQNFPFDATIVGKTWGVEVSDLWMDTMLVHHACYCEMPKSLDFLTSIYTDLPRYSDYNCASDKSTWTYNCHDAAVTRVVALELHKEARELGVWDFYKNHIQPSMIGLTRMQNRGVAVDIELRARKAVECMVALKTAQDTITRELGRPINPASPKQLKEILYGDFKIPKKYHKGTGKSTTNEKALKQLSQKYPQHRNFISSILVYRQKQKLLSTFLTSKLSRKKDVFLCKTSYQTAGTTSGRISSSKTIFGEGGNMQQIPTSDIRCIYIPRRKDRVFIKTDLMRAEFWVVAWLARIKRAMQSYGKDSHFDIHTWNASENIYHCKVEEVTKDMRSAAKAVVHGGNYGLGAGTAVDISEKAGIHITFNEMKHAMEAYHESMPEIREWWDRVKDELHRTRTLKTPMGRIRRFYGRLDESTYRSAYSFLPQSTVGDIINRAIGLAEYILPSGNYPVMQVHDEIVWEVDKGRVGELVPVIRHLMEYPLKVEGVEEPLIIPVEIKVGDNWWDTKELKA